jgi:hypothetical protein
MHKVIAAIAATFVAAQAQAAAANSAAFFSVPALDDLGLVGLSVIVAIAGGLAARRRRK